MILDLVQRYDVGDTGLARFLSLLAARARWVLLEPQPWKCYQVLTSTASNHL